MKATHLICTCNACPTQYEGKLEDGRMFYFRYRGARGGVWLSLEPTSEIGDALDGECLHAFGEGDSYDGHMTHEAVVRELQAAGIEIPELVNLRAEKQRGW